MSKANPRKATTAIFPAPLDCGEGAVVRPMTLGMFAALERIGSPLVTGEEPKDILELIPSLYLVTHDPREVFRGNILDLAMQWANTKSVAVVETIRDAAYRQMNACFDVIPEVADSTPKKKTTDGSRVSPTGRPRTTTGASARSCGKSRSPRSASCADRNGSKPKTTSCRSR